MLLPRDMFILLVAASSSACASPAVRGESVSTGGGKAVDAGPDAHGDASPSPSCDERRAEASNLIAAVVGSPSFATCIADADCTLADTSTLCEQVCLPVAASVSGATALDAAVSKANALCGLVCEQAPHPCPGGPGFVGCTAGVCVTSEIPPPTWLSLSVERTSFPGFGVPPTCPSGVTCTLWTLTPDGVVVVDVSGAMHSAMLSAADFSVVDTIARSLSFRQHVAGMPWSCNSAPTPPTIGMALSYSTLTTGTDVTGCVEAGPAGNDPQRIFQVLSAY